MIPTHCFLVALGLLPTLAVGQLVSPVAAAPQQVLSQPLQFAGYGIHEPHGLAAVKYIYGAEGTWRQFINIENVFGYYNVPPSVQQQLFNYADGANAATCADPNGNVLFNLAPSVGSANGSAFMEHNSRGDNGVAVPGGKPFSQFWYDDNLLARFMSIAYGAPQPDGLYAAPARWQILGLNATGWPQPGGTAPDQLALLGLYYLATGNVPSALQQWQGISTQAGTDWDPNNQRFLYSGLLYNYYLGLFKILTDRLMDAGVTGEQQATLFQHSMSLRSMLRAEQQIESGTFIGWCGDRFDTTSLINTETTALGVLGLGAAAKYSYEADSAPMTQGASFYARPYGALSAVATLSTPGPMVAGPGVTLPSGAYSVDFYMRSGSPAGTALSVELDVYDASSSTVLGTVTITESQIPGSSQWGRYTIPVTITSASNQMEFRVVWSGPASLDVGAIRVR